MKYLFLIIYFVFSIIHLIDSYKDDARKRARSKPFLLIFLLLFYVSASHNRSIFLVLALFTSWLGDVLLIPKGNKWFVAGGISFIFSHIFLILTYASHISVSGMPWLFVIIIAIIYFAVSLKIIFAVKDNTPKMMVGPMYFYLLANSLMNIFGMMQLISRKNTGALIAYIGALLFFVSDCVLFLVRYHKNKNIIYKRHFSVMLTYLLGEFLITLGILLIRG